MMFIGKTNDQRGACRAPGAPSLIPSLKMRAAGGSASGAVELMVRGGCELMDLQGKPRRSTETWTCSRPYPFEWLTGPPLPRLGPVPLCVYEIPPGVPLPLSASLFILNAHHPDPQRRTQNVNVNLE
jgi:hypothetical protein